MQALVPADIRRLEALLAAAGRVCIAVHTHPDGDALGSGTALLAYLLLRFIAWLNKWKHQFSRMFTLVRAVLWNYFRLSSVIECCDTPREHHRHVIRGSPETACQLTFDWSA